MKTKKRPLRKRTPHLAELQARLENAEATLAAIRSGKVDALVVSGPAGEQIYTLKGADRSYRAILEKMAEGAVTVDSDCTVLYSNIYFAGMVASPHSEVVGSSFLRFLHENDHARFQDILKRAAAESVKGEFGLVCSGQKKIWAGISVSKIKIPGEKDVLCLIVHDLTERNNAEKEILKAKNDLEEKVLARTEALKRSNEELEQFAYIASHDLQEPLRTITNYIDIALDSLKPKMDKSESEYLDFIQKGALHAQDLIQSLLNYANLTKKEYPLERTDLNKTMRLTLSNLSAAVEETKAVITHDRLPVVMANGLQVAQLLSNLISNGIKYRNGKVPKIHVGARQDGSNWIVSVRDNGIGIDPQFKDRVFMIFKRLHSRAKYPGTGIGLAICKKIVEQHGGKIWLESAPGKGSAFYFSIPVREIK